MLEHFTLNHIALWAAVTKMTAHLAAVTAIGQFNTRPVHKCGGSAAAVTEIVARLAGGQNKNGHTQLTAKSPVREFHAGPISGAKIQELIKNATATSHLDKRILRYQDIRKEPQSLKLAFWVFAPRWEAP